MNANFIPSTYDEMCNWVMEQTNADAGLVVIFNGNKGFGVSLCSRNQVYYELIPELLEQLARDIRNPKK